MRRALPAECSVRCQMDMMCSGVSFFSVIFAGDLPVPVYLIDTKKANNYEVHII
jgi:hypothetical protein